MRIARSRSGRNFKTIRAVPYKETKAWRNCGFPDPPVPRTPLEMQSWDQGHQKPGLARMPVRMKFG